jgi:hypothetical protein
VKTQRENLLAAAKAASEDYANARRSLETHRSLHALGMSNNLLTAAAIEHSAFARWHRAMATFAGTNI